jgi:hypothetical protein
MALNFQDKIGKLSLASLGAILLYAFVTSIVFGYTGFHWQDKVSLYQRLFLNIVSIISSIILIWIMFKFRYAISIHLNNNLKKIKICYIFLIALVLRIGWVYFSNVTQSSDFLLFEKAAIEILNGKSILSFVTYQRTVGPSLFISIHYFLFGQSQIFPLIGIAILSSLQVLFVYWILISVVNKNTAIFASILLAFFPEHIILTNLLGSDVLFSSICYLGLFLIIKANLVKQNSSTLIYFAVGIVFGINHWVRATSPIFVFSILSFMLLSTKVKPLTRISSAIWVIIGFVITISPIIGFNYSTYGKLDINSIHGQRGKSLLIGTLTEGQGRCDSWRRIEDQDYLSKEMDNYYRDNNILDTCSSMRFYIQDKVYSQIAFKRINENPWGFTRLVLKDKIVNLWGIVAGLGFSLDTSSFSRYKNVIWGGAELWHRLLIMFTGLILILKSFTKVRLWDERQIFVFAAILTTLSHIFLESHPRYHHMFLPLLVMYISEYVVGFNKFPLIRKETL